MVKHIICVGAVCVDTILNVSHFPIEDHKLRALSHTRRRGGNCANTLEVLSQLIFQDSSIGSNSSESQFKKTQIYLLAVLPCRQSDSVSLILNSLPNVKINNTCIFRSEHSEAASSYIIQNRQNNSRTIVSHNPLPEMESQEFIESAERLALNEGVSQGWYHFEGRIPEVTHQCINWLKSSADTRDFKISLECEKPEREYLDIVLLQADVVFFSKLWAKAKGFSNPHECLRKYSTEAKSNALLCCTWGSGGATVLQLKPDGKPEWATVYGWQPPSLNTSNMHVVDTVGAGDTFIAGMLYALTCHEIDWTLNKKLEFANELAGRKVRQEGFQGLGEQMKMASDSPGP